MMKNLLKKRLSSVIALSIVLFVSGVMYYILHDAVQRFKHDELFFVISSHNAYLKETIRE